MHACEKTDIMEFFKTILYFHQDKITHELIYFAFRWFLNHLLRTYKMKNTSLTVEFTSTVLISGKLSTSCTG